MFTGASAPDYYGQDEENPSFPEGCRVNALPGAKNYRDEWNKAKEQGQKSEKPDDFGAVMEALSGKYEFVSADVSMIPSTYTNIEDEEAAVKMQKLLDMLEDNDDVQNVYHNWDMPETDEED